MPMRLDDGWNQIQFNLPDFCKRAYGTAYVETLRVQVTNIPIFILGVINVVVIVVQVHANVRVRRVYFADRVYSEEELPAEFKLFLPVSAPAASAALSEPVDD